MTKQEYYLKLWKRFTQSRGENYRTLGNQISLIPSTWGDYFQSGMWKRIIKEQLINDLCDFVRYESNNGKEISRGELSRAFENHEIYSTLLEFFYGRIDYDSRYRKNREELEKDIYNFLNTTQHDKN